MDGLLNSQNSLSCRDRPQNAINRRQEIDRQSVSQSGTMRPKKSNVKCITFFRYKRWCKLDQKMGCPWRQDRRRRLICSGVDQRKTQGYGMPKMSKEWVWGRMIQEWSFVRLYGPLFGLLTWYQYQTQLAVIFVVSLAKIDLIQMSSWKEYQWWVCQRFPIFQ